MKYVISIIIFVCLVYLGILFLGIVLPSEFEKTERRSFAVPIDVAWDFVTHIENYPQYRDEYSAIQELNQKDGHTYQWQAFTTDGKILVYQVNDFVRNKQFSYQLIKSNDEITGNWIFYFMGDSVNCIIEIAEQSQVKDPIEKVVWYFFHQGERLDREFDLLKSMEQ